MKGVESRPRPQISRRFVEPVYRSRAMTGIMATVRKISAGSAPVLILGRSGTGKEMVARAIHALSPQKPFVKVNCAAIPGTLIESELFGYRKGAFTGASANFAGKAKAADGGTLFLDEIGDLAIEVQPKLLRLIEDKSFEPSGKQYACQHRNAHRLLQRTAISRRLIKGRFLQGGPLLPDQHDHDHDPSALRQERRHTPDDRFFSSKVRGCERPADRRRFSLEAREALSRYEWPGNVRELRNVIERSIILSSGDSIELSDLPRDIFGASTLRSGEKEDLLSSSEVKLIEESLALCAGNVTTAARILGVSRDTLRYRMKKYNIGLGEITP